MDSRIPSVIHAPPVRALGKWILVKLVPRIDKVGSLYLPQKTYIQAEDYAVIVSTGYGMTRKNRVIPHDVSEGDVVQVVRIHEVTATQKAMQAEVGEGYLFLQENDILFVDEEIPKVQIFHDAPMAGEESAP